MTYYKQLLEELPELNIAYDKMIKHTIFMNFNIRIHNDLGKIIEVNTPDNIYRYNTIIVSF